MHESEVAPAAIMPEFLRGIFDAGYPCWNSMLIFWTTHSRHVARRIASQTDQAHRRHLPAKAVVSI
jgi:hypothetical protein